MGKTKDRAKYQAVSLPSEFVETVRNHVLAFPEEYRSIAEFVKSAIMEQIKWDTHGFSRPPNFSATDEIIDKIAYKVTEILKKSKK